jgi:hypothetical protein
VLGRPKLGPHVTREQATWFLESLLGSVEMRVPGSLLHDFWVDAGGETQRGRSVAKIMKASRGHRALWPGA